ncbi:hypothetical protein AJ79_02534 [Helicocarpus griseus UAMH5409]|uniref:Zn(2)-C6 fungal-type domain-containing protein n=1 Tax=Helicocarpus griseus UAMH5409 TaxID=1447875 RepID=A0A2B7Y204_9EURO|nr:hypothetical protein AJ79_02534 [Helicocarpus griseus UAMH5409]
MPEFRVRFASPKVFKSSTPQSPSASVEKQSPAKQRSRSGCRECRQRKVKCDETFPVCLRCQRRGTICQPVMRALQWQLEVPWLADPYANSLTPALNPDANVNVRLMRYWLERMSQIMSLDLNNNPMSFPILKYLSVSPSLVYVIQCVSAAHEQYFQQHNMTTSLEERSKALATFREELHGQNVSLSHSFLTLLMLGMSSSWITIGPSDYGKEHLLAARTVADMVLKKADTKSEELDHLNMGFYVYWDMACSFCLDPADHPVSEGDALEVYVKKNRHKFHTITSHSMDLYYLLGQLGRYCRVIVEGGDHDLTYEAYVEESLKVYESAESGLEAKLLTEAFRKHGLLLLYRFCGIPGLYSSSVEDELLDIETETRTRELALDIVRLLLETRLDSPYLNLHTIPLLSAGAEMTSLDVEERRQVRERLNAVYSTNRLVPTLWVVDLLEELWAIHDAGMTRITWLELMLIKDWRLRIG